MIFKVAKFALISVLLVIGLVQIISRLLPDTVTRPGPINEIMPKHISGWEGAEVPLAQTEELQNQTEAILQFDEVFSYRYTKGSDYITVYIAYWEPGKVPIRKVGVHTPDTCWVLNGWKREAREYAQVRDVNGVLLQPCEYGLFSIQEHYEHVIFWHLVGGEVHSYKQHGLHDIWSPIRDLFRKGLNQKADQYFIRISSNRHIYDLWEDPGMQELLNAVGKLGAFAYPPQQEVSSGSEAASGVTKVGVTSL